MEPCDRYSLALNTRQDRLEEVLQEILREELDKQSHYENFSANLPSPSCSYFPPVQHRLVRPPGLLRLPAVICPHSRTLSSPPDPSLLKRTTVIPGITASSQGSPDLSPAGPLIVPCPPRHQQHLHPTMNTRESHCKIIQIYNHN